MSYSDPPSARPRLAGVWVAVGVVAAVFVVLLGVTVALLLTEGRSEERADLTSEPRVSTPVDPSENPSENAGPSADPGDSADPDATPGPDDVVLESDGDLYAFRSPTGNIGCLVDPGQGEPSVRCEIGDVTWVDPVPRPDDCDLDWGGGEEGYGNVSVGVDGDAGPVCAGDTVRDPAAAELPYGRAVWLSDQLVCRSAETGMRCESLGSGSGFAISRAALELF